MQGATITSHSLEIDNWVETDFKKRLGSGKTVNAKIGARRRSLTQIQLLRNTLSLLSRLQHDARLSDAPRSAMTRQTLA